MKTLPPLSGSEGSRTRSEIEVVNLSSAENYYEPASWCLTSLSSLPSRDNQSFLSWDGATAALVDSHQFSGATSDISLHHQHLLQAVLLCGGADSHYQAGRHCSTLIGRDLSRDCALIGWILDNDVALYYHKDTAQGNKSPLLEAFLSFRCVYIS